MCHEKLIEKLESGTKKSFQQLRKEKRKCTPRLQVRWISQSKVGRFSGLLGPRGADKKVPLSV